MPHTSADTLAALIAREQAGAELDFLFFWGHRPPKSGGVGRSCLSQWWPADFEIDGTRYGSAEHYMMAEKAALFGDESTRQAILDASTPALAKSLGRKVALFDEHRWKTHREEIVIRANLAKFRQNPGLSDFLLCTGARILVEASPLDRIWGIGLAADDARAQSPSSWLGLNLLGFALMTVRDRLGA